MVPRASISVTVPDVDVVNVPFAGVTAIGKIGGAEDCVKLASPLYCALMTASPEKMLIQLNVAAPLLMAALPRVVCPARKVTVPVGVPLVSDTTFAVSDVLLLESEKVVALPAWLTTSLPFPTPTE